jgi:ribosomal protein S18 acetylase RimI-like enzyme
MHGAAPELVIQRSHANDIYEHQKDILSVYAEVYADLLDDPFFSTARYWQRLEGYSTRAGFSFVLGHLDAALIGYAFGYTLPSDSPWWDVLQSDVDPSLLAETGERTFAVTELLVRPPWRRRGYARALHDALLADRQEARATLLVLPDNTAASMAYRSWSWYKIGDLRPFDDAPMFDAMVREL